MKRLFKRMLTIITLLLTMASIPLLIIFFKDVWRVLGNLGELIIGIFQSLHIELQHILMFVL
ncbi:MAG: hypothetical protein LBL47_02125 [Lactobacillus sp.]|nr:hypothetical protein [Lactobacillus sp.]